MVVGICILSPLSSAQTSSIAINAPEVLAINGSDTDCTRSIRYRASGSGLPAAAFHIHFSRTVKNARGQITTADAPVKLVVSATENPLFYTPLLKSNSTYRFSVRACKNIQCSGAAISSWTVKDFETKTLSEAAIGSCSRPLEASLEDRLRFVGNVCSAGAAINSPEPPTGCDGRFRLTALDLNFLLPALPKELEDMLTLSLNYDSGADTSDQYGFGKGWRFNPITTIERSKSSATEASLIDGSGYEHRLVMRKKNEFVMLDGAPGDIFRFSSTEISMRSVDGTRSQMYKALPDGRYVLSELTLREPNKPPATVTFKLGAPSDPGQILFPDGNTIQWSYDAPKRTWSFRSSHDENVIATATLDDNGMLTQAEAKTPSRRMNLAFTYGRNKLLTSYSFSEDKSTNTNYIVYNSDNSLHSTALDGWVTRYFRYRLDDGRAIMRVVHPNDTTDEFVFSSKGLLTQQRSYRGEERLELERHWGAARYSYSDTSIAVPALTKLETQRAGQREDFIFEYDNRFPALLTSATRTTQNGRVISKLSRTYNSVGLLNAAETRLFTADGSKSEITDGVVVTQREQAAPYRPNTIRDLVSGESLEFSYSGTLTTLMTKDRNGTLTTRFTIDRSIPGSPVTSIEDLLGLEPRQDFQYDTKGLLTSFASGDQRRIDLSYDDLGKLIRVRSKEPTGEQKTLAIDPETQLPIAQEIKFPTGLTKSSAYRFTMLPDETPGSVTEETRYADGTTTSTSREIGRDETSRLGATPEKRPGENYPGPDLSVPAAPPPWYLSRYLSRLLEDWFAYPSRAQNIGPGTDRIILYIKNARKPLDEAMEKLDETGLVSLTEAPWWVQRFSMRRILLQAAFELISGSFENKYEKIIAQSYFDSLFNPDYWREALHRMRLAKEKVKIPTPFTPSPSRMQQLSKFLARVAESARDLKQACKNGARNVGGACKNLSSRCLPMLRTAGTLFGNLSQAGRNMLYLLPELGPVFMGEYERARDEITRGSTTAEAIVTTIELGLSAKTAYQGWQFMKPLAGPALKDLLASLSSHTARLTPYATGAPMTGGVVIGSVYGVGFLSVAGAMWGATELYARALYHAPAWKNAREVLAPKPLVAPVPEAEIKLIFELNTALSDCFNRGPLCDVFRDFTKEELQYICDNYHAFNQHQWIANERICDRLN